MGGIENRKQIGEVNVSNEHIFSYGIHFFKLSLTCLCMVSIWLHTAAK